MNDQLEYIGKKIQEKSTELALKTVAFSKEDHVYSLNYTRSESIHSMQTRTFYLLGSYLASCDEDTKKTLLSFADIYAQKAISRLSTLDQVMRFVYLSRTIISDFLEEELKQGFIQMDTVFQTMKIIDPICLSISNTFINHYNDKLSSTKFALDESNEDLRITLKELTELKNALNEATIFSICDLHHQFTYVNDKFCNASQYSKEELLGQPHSILDSAYHPPFFFEQIDKTLLNGHVWKGEVLKQAKDGSHYWVDTTIVPLLDHTSTPYQFISIQYDITEKKRAEEMLQKTEKLSMVGELAAGIAHEIRNPLTTIKGFVQLMGESKQEDFFTETILGEIERINFIVNEFMVFAKPHDVLFSECNLSIVLQDLISFLKPEALLKNVTITQHLPKEDVTISGEKHQLKQVFLNLIKNAIEALPNGGNVTVTMETTMEEVIISIIDNGIGLSSEQLQRIGEPFFTTKASGNGLGLMVSYKIIQNHSGSITVKSEPNKGTTFSVRFLRAYSQLAE